MNTVLGLMISFAATGEIGAFRLGMSGEEADLLLGGGTDLAAPALSGSGGAVGFKDGSLEVWVDPGLTVGLLGFDAVDAEGRFEAPSRTGAAGRAAIEAPSREAVIDGLEQLGCAWRRDEALTFDDQLAIRTEADVSVLFRRPEPPANEWVLANLYRSASRQ
ncbi:hypothetical protein OHV05_00195 [Kitasatospora sp. NBC_00070]|uniref:hypothetical protein n=1 Tax=Kitasatospora sp. NBC_00070 TaxID=2975962 RepID=UPI003243694E